MKRSSKKGFKQKDHSRVSATSVSGATSSAVGSVKGKDSRLSKAADATEEYALSFPELKILDTNKLRCYSSILKKPKDEMITMDDLDNLQLELETLLSAVSVRLRDLHSEIDLLSSNDESVKEKKIKLVAGKTMLSKKADDRTTLKISKPVKEVKLLSSIGIPPVKSKSKSTLPIEEEALPDHVIHDGGVSDPSKALLPKNDTTNKFWAFVDEYCTEIGPDEIKYLEDLKANCEKDAESTKIPPLGKHYTLRWAEEDLTEERDSSGAVKLKRKSSDGVSNASSGNNGTAGEGQNASNNNNSGPKELLKKAEKICIGERIPGPLAQRLISALLEENINVTPLQDSGNILSAEKQSGMTAEQEIDCPTKRQKLDTSNSGVTESKGGGENAVPNFVKKLPLYHTSVCFERRIRRGLEAAGFLDTQHPPQEDNDEILKELKKCQEELRKCALHNVGQLKRVLELAQTEMTRNQVRKKIRHMDNEIIEVYRRFTAAKLKNKQIGKKEREQAWCIVHERESWQKRFQSLLSSTLS